MTEPDDIALASELLEPLLREFVDLIGLAATMAIVERYGGTRLLFRSNPEENAELVALVGAEKAALLDRQYRGDRPLIPKALPALRAVRNRKLQSDLEVMSRAEIARKYGLGERRVYQLARELDDTTPGLFD